MPVLLQDLFCTQRFPGWAFLAVLVLAAEYVDWKLRAKLVSSSVASDSQ
jgi:hypothetical protein